MTVLESYIFLESEISAEEEYTSHSVKSDGGVVTLVGVPSAAEAFGDNSDTEVVWIISQVSGAQQYERTDAGTATMLGVVSGRDGKGYSDAATATMLGTPSGSDTLNHGYPEAATVTLTAVPSGTDTRTYPEAESIIRMFSVISALDERNYPPDAATITMTGTPSGPDLKAHWFVDADTGLLTGVVSGSDSKQNAPDAATITVTGTVSAVESKQSVDAATVTGIGTPSGTDLKAHWFVDAATVTYHVDQISSNESDDHVDAATLTWHVDQISALEEYGHNDAATLTWNVDQISGVDEYTAAVTNEIYIAALFTGSNKTFDTVVGGGGATWTDRKDSDNSASHTKTWVDLNTAGHGPTDLPVLEVDFTDGPLTDHGYAVILAAGDGLTTPTITTSQDNSGNGDDPTIHETYFGPAIGDLIVIFINIDNDGVAGATPTGYTLIDSGTVGAHNHWYIYSRYPSTGDGGGGGQDDRTSFSLPTTGTNIHWTLCLYSLTDPGTDAYVLDKGTMTDVSTNETFTAATHGP